MLCAYSLHDPAIGYCQSMNFIVGMMLLLMSEEDAFWLLCAMMQPAFLPADNYAHSMVGTQIDQLVFQRLVERELPELAAHLTHCGIQIHLITLHWFLCAFVCTLPTEAALRVWDWFFLDGQEVLFAVAIGILKLEQTTILSVKTHSELHAIVRRLGTHLHDEDALMGFLYSMRPKRPQHNGMLAPQTAPGTTAFTMKDIEAVRVQHWMISCTCFGADAFAASDARDVSKGAGDQDVLVLAAMILNLAAASQVNATSVTMASKCDATFKRRHARFGTASPVSRLWQRQGSGRAVCSRHLHWSSGGRGLQSSRRCRFRVIADRRSRRIQSWQSAPNAKSSSEWHLIRS